MNEEERMIWIEFITCDRYFYEGRTLYCYAVKGRDWNNVEYYHSWQGRNRYKTFEELEVGSLIKISHLRNMIGE